MGKVINSNMSSAKRPHLWVWAPQVTPWMLGLEHMSIASFIIAMVKIKGDRGH